MSSYVTVTHRIVQLPIGVTSEVEYEPMCGGMQTVVLKATGETEAAARDKIQRALDRMASNQEEKP